MSVFTLEEIDEQIAAYKQALMLVSVGKETSIGLRRFTQQDLPEIRKTLEWLDTEKSRLQSGYVPGPVSISPKVGR